MRKKGPAPTTPYGRFALFIDGSNFYHTLRDLNLHVDYKRLLDYFSARGTLIHAYYYTALLADGQSPEWLIRLTDWLSYHHYQVCTKQARSIRRRVQNEENDWIWINEIRGSIHIELAVEMIGMAPHLDTALLFSGDGNYRSLIQAVQRAGCRVIVVSSETTAESTVADELRRQADEFIELAAISGEISMAPRAPRPPADPAPT